MTHYVEVSEHTTWTKFVPFSTVQPKVPGGFISGRLFGPYTDAGAERVARAALASVHGKVNTYPKSGNRYVTDGDGTRMVHIYDHLPYGRTAARNMPRGY